MTPNTATATHPAHMVSTCPVVCPKCATPVAPIHWDRLTSTGPWIQTTPCPQCARQRDREALLEARERHLAHYRAAVPANYRPLSDGGTTDIRHPDWAEFKGSAQLHSLKAWDRRSHPWAAIIGPGGHLKTRVAGLAARELALQGLSLLWVNGASLGWASSTRADRQRSGASNEHLHTWRTHDGILILDDLWKGNLTPSYVASLYHLLEHRNAHRLPLLWTANTHPAHMGAHLNADNRDPIIGRLIENTHLIDLFPRPA